MQGHPVAHSLVDAAAELLTSMDMAPTALKQRLEAIGTEVDRSGTYTLTPQELTHGARLAWYNSNRCIARHLWRTLHVFDARRSVSAPAVFDALRTHMTFAYNGGTIRNAITIFPPRPPSGIASVRLENRQLVQFAGFRNADGGVTGDPANITITQQCLDAGWRPVEQGPFVPLPWLLCLDGVVQPPFDVLAKDPALSPMVRLAHPENAAIEKLELQWYPVPLLSDMALVVGGIVFPFAPFNGHYMVTEIGSRDLADTERYNALPAVAQCFGWDTTKERTLWRDRAVVELNRAVLYSFDRDGVQLSDHHAISTAFERFCLSEQRAGRIVTGDWAWLVPPTSGALSPQFHRTFDSTVSRGTNFFYQTPVAPDDMQRIGGGCPYHL
jgi:nitric-oxide synthase